MIDVYGLVILAQELGAFPLVPDPQIISSRDSGVIADAKLRAASHQGRGSVAVAKMRAISPTESSFPAATSMMSS